MYSERGEGEEWATWRRKDRNANNGKRSLECECVCDLQAPSAGEW